MKRAALFLVVAAGLLPAAAASQAVLSPELQIRLAVQAAPPDLREGATVQGYDADGAFVVLREGTGGLVCMAPNPTAEAFEVSCHHAGLEAYFARGRELRAEGLAANEVTQRRYAEVEAGSLELPYGGINYILTGDGFDPETAEVRNPFVRWVIYTPGATPESTGITGRPAEGAPWLMFPGTPGSHIMIVPPRTGAGG